MKFWYGLTMMVAGLAYAGPILEQRATNNYTGVLTDISAINSSLASLTSSINNFTPNDIVDGFFSLVESISLGNQIQQTTTDTQNSAPFGVQGSNKIAAAILALEKPIYAALSAITVKKPAFQQGLFGIPLNLIVLGILNNLKNDTDTLGTAITAKLDASLKSVAPTIIKQIDDHFTSAITAYSS